MLSHLYFCYDKLNNLTYAYFYDPSNTILRLYAYNFFCLVCSCAYAIMCSFFMLVICFN